MINEFPKDLRFYSEEFELFIQHLIGKWYVRSKYVKDTYGPHSVNYVDNLQEWWWGMRKLSSLLIACPGTTHACLVMNNHMQDVKRMIEKEISIEFSFTDGDNLNFRGLVNFDLEFPEFDDKFRERIKKEVEAS